MPLIHKRELPSGAKVGLWKITEDHNSLLSGLKHLKDIPDHRNKRSLQWMAARRTVLELCEAPDLLIYKDEFGKPRVKGMAVRISITHCGDYAAAIVCSKNEVGIDLETLSPRIHRVKHKFVLDDEADTMLLAGDVEGPHIIWGAKECLYKWYGRREVDFRSHLHIDDYDKGTSSLIASINKGPYKAQIKLNFEYVEDMLLVYTDGLT